MKIYHYHPSEKVFLRETTARPDPKEKGSFLIPAYATGLQPPEASKGEIAIFENGEWVSKINKKGQVYYQQDGTEVEIKEYGKEIPAGCIQDDPPSEFHTTHDGTNWIEDVALKEATENSQEIESLKGDLRKALAWQFKMILELFEVGRENGVWVNADFSDEIKAKAVEWKTKLSRLDELDH